MRISALIGTVRARQVLKMFVVATASAIMGQTWWAIDEDKRATLESERSHLLLAVRLLEEHGTDFSAASLARFYDRMAEINQADIQLLDREGRVIVHSLSAQQGVFRGVLSAAARAGIAGGAEGVLTETSTSQGQPDRLWGFRRVAGFPVTVFFGRRLDLVLAGWRERTADRVKFSLLFVVSHLLLTYFLLRQMRRVQDRESQLRESEARFVDLFQLAPIPLAMICLENDVVLEANNAILHQLSYDRAQFIGHTLLELGLWVGADTREQYLARLARDRIVEDLEVPFRTRDGRQLTCLLSSRLMYAGQVRVAIFSPIDITGQRQHELRILELNAELEARVASRTAHLQHALSALRAMQAELVRHEKLAALGVLVSGIAHELNTPLGNSITVATTVQEHLSALTSELAGTRPSRARIAENMQALGSGMDLIVRNLGRTAGLVQRFKLVAADPATDSRCHFDVTVLVRTVLASLQRTYPGHCLRQELGLPVMMDSYPGSLEYIITQLVENAVVHAFDHGERGIMSVRLFSVQDEVLLEFSDNGKGMSEQQVGRVFDPFFTTRFGQGNAGLGMNIVYNLATRVLNGKIAVESSPGTGTRIAIRMPKVCSRPAPADAVAPLDSDCGRSALHAVS